MQKLEDGTYLDKDRFGYKIIYPWKNEDGSINWFNLCTGGSWYNLMKVSLIVLLILGMVWSYKHDVSLCLGCVEDPCDYCYGEIIPDAVANNSIKSLDLSTLPQEMKG